LRVFTQPRTCLKTLSFLRAINISDLAGNGNLFVAAEPGILFPGAPALP
jgi:hypothetical protein